MSKDSTRAVAEEMQRLADRARREGRNQGQLQQLKALEAYIDSLVHECKTIGNMNPKPYHCFACTWTHLHEEVRKAIEFWSQSCYRDSALS